VVFPPPTWVRAAFYTGREESAKSVEDVSLRMNSAQRNFLGRRMDVLCSFFLPARMYSQEAFALAPREKYEIRAFVLFPDGGCGCCSTTPLSVLRKSVDNTVFSS